MPSTQGDDSGLSQDQPDYNPENLFTTIDHATSASRSVRFNLNHESLTHKVRRSVEYRILIHGGVTVESLGECDILLVSEADLTIPLDVLVLSYDVHPNPKLRGIYVEPTCFVERCIEDNYFALGRDRKPKKGMPGRRPRDWYEGPRSPPTEFVVADDENLCRYLGMRIPEKAFGGRSGDNVYQDLVDLAHFSHYQWARRHSWQSWRSRYTSHREDMDARIAALAKKDRRFDAKGEYPRARRPRKHSWTSSDRSPSSGVSPDNNNARSVVRRHGARKRLAPMREPAGLTPAPACITHEDDHPLDWYFPEDSPPPVPSISHPHPVSHSATTRETGGVQQAVCSISHTEFHHGTDDDYYNRLDLDWIKPTPARTSDSGSECRNE